MRISDFLEASNEATSPECVVEVMERAAGDVGFERYAYCALTRHDSYDAGLNPAPAVVHNFPDAWRDHYFEKNYQAKDPVVLFAPEIETPFEWGDLKKRFKLDAEQQKIMEEAREFGLEDGVGVPLHGARGNVCLLSFARAEHQPVKRSDLAKLEVIATQFHSAYSTVGRVDRRSRRALLLSLRERECLQWIAQGKSSWDIAAILDISENTVNFHVKNALAKLDANTRTLAVVKAIRYGLIAL